MAAVDRRASHRRSVKVTALASLGGVLAGVGAQSLASGPTDTMGVVMAAAGVLASMAVMRLVGIDVEAFSTKDHLYVAFMVVSLWFVVWTILLTTGTSV